MMREGDRRKSILTGIIYEVKVITDCTVALESLDGSSKVWTERDNLRMFYEKVENDIGPENLKLSQSPKPLRSPGRVSVDFV